MDMCWRPMGREDESSIKALVNNNKGVQRSEQCKRMCFTFVRCREVGVTPW